MVAFCDGGYTTNLPLEDVTDGKAWIAFDYDGEPLDPEHGGPRDCSSPPLLLEEREVGARAPPRHTTSRASGRPSATTTTATRGRSSGTGATDPAPAAWRVALTSR